MDGFVSRGQVIVIGATNIPEVLDPASGARTIRPRDRDRRPQHAGAAADPQDSFARHAARADVDLQEIAEHSHGFVGADLEALCRKSG